MLGRRTALLTTSAALTASGLLLAGTPSAGAATARSTVSLTLGAYGSYAKVGPVTSGTTATFGACSSTTGTSYGSKVAATDLGGRLGKVGAVVTSGTRSGNKATVTSSTGATSLLNGLVQASAIKSTSVSELSGTSLRSSGSTVVTGLKIDGKARSVPAGVGARIDVPDVARITFNRQTTTSTSVSTKLTVDAIRIDLLKGNRLGLDTGTIVLSSSTSGASRPTFFASSGQAYGTTVTVGDKVASDRTAYVGMPCGGTGGAVVHNEVGDVSLPGAVKTGGVSSTGQSVEGSTTSTATFTNRVTSVNLLDGVVTADAVAVRAKSTRAATGFKNYDTGTEITNLKVLGRSVKVASTPNSTVEIAGVGTLTTHKAVSTTVGLDVVGLELKVASNRGQVKAGTVIDVAVAKSRVQPR